MNNATRTHHALGFSKLDKLNECLDFTGKPVGAAANRGTDKHDATQGHIEGTKISTDPYIISAAARIQAYIPTILSIEEKLPLLVGFREVSFGYADYIGLDENGNLVIVDLKTGSQPASSYRLQMMALSLAAMDHYGHKSAKAVLVYADSDTDSVYAFEQELAENELFSLFAKLDARNEPRQKNDFCSWCKLQGTCPVWLEPAKEVATLAPNALGLLFTEEDAKSRPEVYLGAFNALEAILIKQWGIKDIIKERLEGGERVDGWKLQDRKGSTSIQDTEKFLIEVVKKMGAAKAAPFIKVDPKILAEWAKFTTESFPVPVVESPGTTALVAEKGGK